MSIKFMSFGEWMNHNSDMFEACDDCEVPCLKTGCPIYCQAKAQYEEQLRIDKERVAELEDAK
jgi:hypothetical protein